MSEVPQAPPRRARLELLVRRQDAADGFDVREIGSGVAFIQSRPQRVPEGSYELAEVESRVAADESLGRAFPEAGDWRSVYGPFDVGVIIGTGWGGLDSANRNNNDYQKTGMASAYSTLMAMNNAATAAVSQNFGLRGPQSTPVAACASGAIAIGEAYQMIRAGRARMMLAGGSETLREIFNLYCIDVLDALSKERTDPARASRPFALRR